ncbi:MAG: hypothetical protein V3T22_06830, partial [Planctomycetota bacterium]
MVSSLRFVVDTTAVSILSLAAACSSAPAARPGPDVPSRGSRPEPSELPEGWEYSPASVFERLVSGLTAGDSRIVWSSAALGSLTRVLDEPDGSAVRAAVLLAHSDADRATEILMQRLERRAPSVSRSLDAGDLV